jgi:hypothetical protein
VKGGQSAVISSRGKGRRGRAAGVMWGVGVAAEEGREDRV